MTEDRFKRAEILRQHVLDFLNANPSSRVPDVCQFLHSIGIDIHREVVGNNMRYMYDMGELHREGTINNMRYTALKTITVSADAIKARVREASRVLKPRKKEAVESEKWVTIRKEGYVRHNGMNRSHPIRDQGGQGRREFGMQSSFSLI